VNNLIRRFFVGCCKIELRGKNVLVTGGAMGMGKSMAGLFLKEGARVAIVDVREAELAAATKELAPSGQIAAYVCDISDKWNIYSLAEKLKKEFGTIDILVNNAGVVRSAPFLQKTDEAIEKLIAVNLMSIFWTTKAFLPDMVSKGEGVIVNMASAGGLLGVPYISDYCASKFAVVGLTESLRQEMALAGQKKIKFIYVCPNTVSTGMFEGAQAVKGTRMLTPEDVTVKIIEGIKNGRAMIGVPSSVYTLPLVKAILPIGAMDFLCRVLGIATSSKNMTGRKDSIILR
jgi:all-trans-retinol dehydrogenase (NAD+)